MLICFTLCYERFNILILRDLYCCSASCAFTTARSTRPSVTHMPMFFSLYTSLLPRRVCLSIFLYPRPPSIWPVTSTLRLYPRKPLRHGNSAGIGHIHRQQVIIFPSISPLSSVPSTPPASPSPLSPLAGKLKLGCAGFVVEYRERSASLASVRFCFRRCVKPFVPSLQEISTKSGLLI